MDDIDSPTGPGKSIVGVLEQSVDLENVEFDEAIKTAAKEIKATDANEIGALSGQLSSADELFASTGWVNQYDWGEASILRSTDFGKTWKSANVPFAKTEEVQRIDEGRGQRSDWSVRM